MARGAAQLQWDMYPHPWPLTRPAGRRGSPRWRPWQDAPTDLIRGYMVPTSAEVEQLLTGPGGPFEVVRETVNGIDMKVYKERMRSLREIAAMARDRGDDQVYLVYGDERIGFARFIDEANSVSSHLAADAGVRRGDRVAVLSANNPSWVHAFWGTVDLGAIL